MKRIDVAAAAFALSCAWLPSVEPVDAAALGAKLSASNRPDEDKARDAGRKPGEVVAFLGIEPGMTVVDLIAAGGYYTEVLSIAVGPEGRVYAQNNEYVLKLRDGVNEKSMSARLANGRLPNVERRDEGIQKVGLAPGSVDAAITALNLHDLMNSRGPEVTGDFLAVVHAFLKPGGIFGVIDHDGDPDEDNKELHRIPEEDARRVLEAAGFEIEATGEMLRNPEDDHTKNVFAPGLRGKTDRFVLRLRKPAY